MATKRISDLVQGETLDGSELFEISQLSIVTKITATTISAAAADNSYNDSAAGFVAAGFAVGDRVSVSGFTGAPANNILVGTITALTTSKMTIGGTDGDVIADDAAGESVTIAKWTSKRSSMQEILDLAGSASLPTGGTTGQVLTKQSSTDGDADWETPSGGGGGAAWYFDPPLASSLPTLVSPDANNLTLTDDADVGLLVDPGVVNTNDDLRCAMKTISSPTADWSVEIAIQCLLQGTNFTGVGLAIRDSVGGRVHTWRIASASNGLLSFTCTRWTSVTAFSAETLTRTYNGVMDSAFLRIRQVSGVYYFDRSHNGKQWVEHTTQANNAFLASPANQVGLVCTVNNANADSRSYFNVMRWVESGL